ncbi:hypothetical protein ACFQ2B_06085 [Streptomyces stramineus]|uniref:Uncharacterized protein n=1 Tax=Streptomyces stramineus TaxID=173861 RepID=A0ABN1AKI7_9ACTN
MAHTRPSDPYAPARGELVWDSARQRLGEVMDRTGSHYQLRPLGGGTEWNAAPDDITPSGRPRLATHDRCAECQEIKARHREATRVGDLDEARSWTATMGRHQRLAHS